MTARSTMKKSGRKAAMHKACQAATKGTLRRARKASQSRRPVVQTFKPPFANDEYLANPEVNENDRVRAAQAQLREDFDRPITTSASEASTADTDVCDSCGKTVRVKKNGALYSHKCA